MRLASLSAALVLVQAGCGGGSGDHTPNAEEAEEQVQSWWGSEPISVFSCEATGEMWQSKTVYDCRHHEWDNPKPEHRGYWGIGWSDTQDEWDVTALCVNSVGDYEEVLDRSC